MCQLSLVHLSVGKEICSIMELPIALKSGKTPDEIK